jgi:transposase-like protein
MAKRYMRRDKESRIEAFAMAELAGEKASDWAKRHGVNPRTVRRWRSDPAYQDRLSKARGRMVQQVVTRLATIALDAVGELETLLKTSQTEMVRLQAAKAIIHGLLAVGNFAEVKDQLETVLNRLSEIRGNGQPVSYKLADPTG